MSTPSSSKPSCATENGLSGSPPKTVADSAPLFWTHINPYGRFYLDMDTRLDLTA